MQCSEVRSELLYVFLLLAIHSTALDECSPPDNAGSVNIFTHKMLYCNRMRSFDPTSTAIIDGHRLPSSESDSVIDPPRGSHTPIVCRRPSASIDLPQKTAAMRRDSSLGTRRSPLHAFQARHSGVNARYRCMSIELVCDLLWIFAVGYVMRNFLEHHPSSSKE